MITHDQNIDLLVYCVATFTAFWIQENVGLTACAIFLVIYVGLRTLYRLQNRKADEKLREMMVGPPKVWFNQEKYPE